jgi:hypothetical protein
MASRRAGLKIIGNQDEWGGRCRIKRGHVNASGFLQNLRVVNDSVCVYNMEIQSERNLMNAYGEFSGSKWSILSQP